MTFQGQMEANKAAEQEKRATAEMEGMMKAQTAKVTTDGQNKSAVLTGILNMYLKAHESGRDIPAELKPLAQEVLKSVALPAAIENEQIQQAVAQRMQEAMDAQGQQQPPAEAPPQIPQQQPVQAI
jgi:hypothetical protein